MAGLAQLYGQEVRDYWRLDAIAFCLLIPLGVLLRTPLFGSFIKAAVVTGLVEPVTFLVVIAVRPAFLNLLRRGSLTIGSLAMAALLLATAALATTAWAKLVNYFTWSVPGWNLVQNWIVPWGYHYSVLISWSAARFWAGAEFSARLEQQRAAAAEAEAMRAELLHLRHQLDPHFIFNALNGIAAEIDGRPKAATEMVHELADYLRYSLDRRDQILAPLASEIDAVRSYLDVQKARFGDDLRFTFDADQAARAQTTPSYLLQPLVENAVKHGIKAGAIPLEIAVCATRDGDTLAITVAGAGKLRDDWRTAGNPGVGLSVMQRRLELHYPGRHHFGMRQLGDKVVAELKLKGEPCSA